MQNHALDRRTITAALVTTDLFTKDSRTDDVAVIDIERERGRDVVMRAETGRIYETGVRIGLFIDSTPDPEADEGYTSLVKREKDVVEQMRIVAMEQRAGLLGKAAGSEEKSLIREEAKRGPMTALSQVAKRARKDHGDIAMQFRYKPGQQSYVDFEGAARSMLTAAEAHKETLVPYGLSSTVVVSLTDLLDRFAKARELCDQGRIAHKTATQRLETLAQDLGSIIRTMDARNRVRYKDDPQTLAKWVAARTLLGTRGAAQADGAGEQPASGPVVVPPAQQVAGGDVRPAT